MTTQEMMKTVLRDFLETGSHAVGDRLPSMRELAARYQASYTTVGKTIALLAEEGWLTKRQGSGIYVAALARPAHRARGGPQPQRRMGYITQDIHSVLAHRVFEGVEYVARKNNCVVEVASTDWDIREEHHQIEQMRQRGVQGVVLYPTTDRVENNEYLAREFQDFSIVVVDLYQPDMKRSHLLFDNWSAGREMTRYLLKQGRREIAFLKYSNVVAYRSIDDREAGYRRSLEEAGLPLSAARVLAFKPTPGDLTDHHAALDRLLALRPPPDAIITPYDSYAQETIRDLQARGVAVPDDILVAGFDNLQEMIGESRFPTTQPDFIVMGERAAEMLLRQIGAGKPEQVELVLPCPLLLPQKLNAKAATKRRKIHK